MPEAIRKEHLELARQPLVAGCPLDPESLAEVFTASTNCGLLIQQASAQCYLIEGDPVGTEYMIDLEIMNRLPRTITKIPSR